MIFHLGVKWWEINFKTAPENLMCYVASAPNRWPLYIMHSKWNMYVNPFYYQNTYDFIFGACLLYSSSSEEYWFNYKCIKSIFFVWRILILYICSWNFCYGHDRLKGPYADHILIPRAQPEVVYFLVSNGSPYFSNCKSEISPSNSL